MGSKLNILQKSNEIELKIKIKEEHVNTKIYFLNESPSDDDDKPKFTKINTNLIINREILPFEKYFIPKKSGIYSIKLIFKIN